ncbi:MAG: hypothetical protein CL816_08205 [Coxiellaceae bacterium]|nr:hypothetical protein [Coxiellaceae bacterium]|tara:strand:- start:10094 stop:11278 length:1185 start_codon:yes stop_codon:yes gene_type:complete
MSFTIALTEQLFNSVFEWYAEPGVFFIRLLNQLRDACYPYHLSLSVFGDSRELLQYSYNTLSVYPELSDVSLAIRDRLLIMKNDSSIKLFDDCSIHYRREGKKKHSLKTSQKPINFILSSHGYSQIQYQLPHFNFMFSWHQCADFFGFIRTNKKSDLTYYCFDYDETLFSSLQGVPRYHYDLIDSMKKLVSMDRACILTARTDPVYLYFMISQLLKNPTMSIDVEITKFDRERFQDLSSGSIKALQTRYRSIVAPRHRKQLIVKLIKHLVEILTESRFDKSPWQVELIPNEALIFFMNSNIQLIINKCVAHLIKKPNLKGSFARKILDNYPEYKQIILVDDNIHQGDDWQLTSKRGRTKFFSVNQSFDGSISSACEAVSVVVRNTDNFFTYKPS